jgi:hypothetical protein
MRATSAGSTPSAPAILSAVGSVTCCCTRASLPLRDFAGERTAQVDPRHLRVAGKTGLGELMVLFSVAIPQAAQHPDGHRRGAHRPSETNS